VGSTDALVTVARQAAGTNVIRLVRVAPSFGAYLNLINKE
jgi:hypothetical protein